MKKKVIFILGPTGSGKTDLGIKLGNFLPCEFISADSMQIYKGMDIITDKLPKSMRRKYRHYLVDIVKPGKDYNAANFVRSARRFIGKVLKKRKIPVVIGGTGLYINSLLYGIFKAGRSKSGSLRRKLEKISKEKGIDFLFERLAIVDPHAASKINPNDLRRIIRALEVYELTKNPISVLQHNKKPLSEDYKIYIFGLQRPRSELYERIDSRVDEMMKSGLVKEVSGLLKKKLSSTAYYCIGIREIEGYLKGQHSLDEAVRLIKRNSRRFAKRQLTWFKKNKDIEWVDLSEYDDLSSAARHIFKKIII